MLVLVSFWSHSWDLKKNVCSCQDCMHACMQLRLQGSNPYTHLASTLQHVQQHCMHDEAPRIKSLHPLSLNPTSICNSTACYEAQGQSPHTHLPHPSSNPATLHAMHKHCAYNEVPRASSQQAKQCNAFAFVCTQVWMLTCMHPFSRSKECIIYPAVARD